MVTLWQSSDANAVVMNGQLPILESTPAYAPPAEQYQSGQFTQFMANVSPGMVTSLKTWLPQSTIKAKLLCLENEPATIPTA